MKIFLIILGLLIFNLICYAIYYSSLYIRFQHVNVNDAIWVESHKEGIIVPLHITKVDKNENGKVVCIHLENEKTFTFDELRKSEYTL